jgi:hypothetical protein
MTGVDTSTQPRTARIFLSYKRNIEPDQTLAREVEAALSAAGHAVFIDQRLLVGQAWAEEIERQVQSSDFLVVFLTEESGRSEMVRGEIEIARRAAAIRSLPRILPVRVDFDGPLPYPLSAYLDKIQYAIWRGRQDTSRLHGELLAAIRGEAHGGAASASTPSDSSTTLPPPYAAPLPLPGDALEVDDPWYLERPADRLSASYMAEAGGQTLTIKGPRQMGKSSLLLRVVKIALGERKRVALLDFQLIDDQTRADADLFYRRFASSIAEQLDLPDSVATFWDAGLTNPQNCTRYVERQILKAVREPCMIAIDETESMFRSAFSSDFFAMLRSWHGLRPNPTRPAWRNLDIVLSTSSEPEFFIDRPHESPFNVGLILPLDDFALEQVASLNALHPRPLAAGDVEKLYSLVHGHPYLTRKALYILAGRTPTATPPQFFETATDDTGPFGDHLRYYLLRLQNKPELIGAFRRLIEVGSGVEEAIVHRLESFGVIRREGRSTVPRCDLYASYFRERLRGGA